MDNPARRDPTGGTGPSNPVHGLLTGAVTAAAYSSSPFLPRIRFPIQATPMDNV